MLKFLIQLLKRLYMGGNVAKKKLKTLSAIKYTCPMCGLTITEESKRRKAYEDKEYVCIKDNCTMNIDLIWRKH